MPHRVKRDRDANLRLLKDAIIYQKIWTRVGLMSLGFLGGFCLLKFIYVSVILSKVTIPMAYYFVDSYSFWSLGSEILLYILIVLSFVAVLDWFDFGHKGFQHFVGRVSSKKPWPAILLILVLFILYLCLAPETDMIILHHTNRSPECDPCVYVPLANNTIPPRNVTPSRNYTNLTTIKPPAKSKDAPTPNPTPKIFAPKTSKVTLAPTPKIAGALKPKTTGSPKPKVTDAKNLKVPDARKPKVTDSQKSKVTGSQKSKTTGAQKSKTTGAENPKTTGAQKSKTTGAGNPKTTGALKSKTTGAKKPKTTSKDKVNAKPPARVKKMAEDIKMEKTKWPTDDEAGVKKETNGSKRVTTKTPHHIPNQTTPTTNKQKPCDTCPPSGPLMTWEGRDRIAYWKRMTIAICCFGILLWIIVAIFKTRDYLVEHLTAISDYDKNQKSQKY